MKCQTCRCAIRVMVRKGSGYCGQHCDPNYMPAKGAS